MNKMTCFVFAACIGLPLPAQEPAGGPPKPAPAEPKVLQLGQRVDGALSLPDLDGKVVNAQEHMGKITVVNFYSIQCPIQRNWDQRLASIQREFSDQGVVFLHIDSNVTEIGAAPPAADGEAKPYAKIRDHLQAGNLPFRVLVDHGNRVADLFDAKTTPHIYVFGKDGRLVYKGLVDDDQKDRNPNSRNNYLRDVLQKLQTGEKVEPFATKEEGCTIKRVAKGGGRGDAPRKGAQ